MSNETQDVGGHFPRFYLHWEHTLAYNQVIQGVIFVVKNVRSAKRELRNYGAIWRSGREPVLEVR
jgi:hypothetical protein